MERAAFLAALPVVLGTRYLCFVLGGIYRRVWRYAATTDELVIAVACAVSAVLSWLIIVSLRGLDRVPLVGVRARCDLRDVLVGGARLAFRALRSSGGERRGDRERSVASCRGRRGRLGRSFAREARETPGMRVVGFVDDNPALRGRRIAGQRVLGAA